MEQNPSDKHRRKPVNPTDFEQRAILNPAVQEVLKDINEYRARNQMLDSGVGANEITREDRVNADPTVTDAMSTMQRASIDAIEALTRLHQAEYNLHLARAAVDNTLTEHAMELELMEIPDDLSELGPS